MTLPLTPLQSRRRAPRPPVGSLDADALHRELVEDAVAGYATPLDRAVRAYERIARLRDESPDDAFQRVRAEVASLRGRPGMPMV